MKLMIHRPTISDFLPPGGIATSLELIVDWSDRDRFLTILSVLSVDKDTDYRNSIYIRMMMVHITQPNNYRLTP